MVYFLPKQLLAEMTHLFVCCEHHVCLFSLIQLGALFPLNYMPLRDRTKHMACSLVGAVQLLENREINNECIMYQSQDHFYGMN